MPLITSQSYSDGKCDETDYILVLVIEHRYGIVRRCSYGWADILHRWPMQERMMFSLDEERLYLYCLPLASRVVLTCYVDVSFVRDYVVLVYLSYCACHNDCNNVILV